MSTATKAFGALSADAKEASKRIAAAQLTQRVKETFISSARRAAKKNKAKMAQVDALEKALEGPFGDALFMAALSVMLQPAAKLDDKGAPQNFVAHLTGELRTQSLQRAGNEVANSVLEPLMAILRPMIEGGEVNEAVETIAAATGIRVEPEKIEKKTGKAHDHDHEHEHHTNGAASRRAGA